MAQLKKLKGYRSLDDQETLGLFVHNLKEGVYITTPQGEILDANPAFLEMFGLNSLAELGEYTAGKLVVDPQRRSEELEILAREGAVRDFEFQIRRPDGELRTVVDTCYQVADAATGQVVYHGILIDITERKALEIQLRDMAIRDPLTGCYNRNFLKQTELRLNPTTVIWGVVIVDVDHFKEYNDRYGHDEGDRILVQTGRFLNSQLRSEDAVIRTGGDEFLTLVLDVRDEELNALADRIRGVPPCSPPVPLSAGCALRWHTEPLQNTIRRADKQMILNRQIARSSCPEPARPAVRRRRGNGADRELQRRRR